MESQKSEPGEDGRSEPVAEAPIHPVPQLQGPFEESMMEALSSEPDSEDTMSAEARRAKLLGNEKYERVCAGRWKQKPGEKYHPLWKLSAQLSFGVHLLAQGLAKSDGDVMAILQNHVDDIDGFLERTLEDFELSQNDVQERLQYLRLPLEHIDVFDQMLEDRTFRNNIVTGNEKIEHIVDRTSLALRDALKDCQKGLDSSKSLGVYLNSIKGRWKTESSDFEAIYMAMVGNCEGWIIAFSDLLKKADRLSIVLAQLNGIIDEMQRRCGFVSRKSLAPSASAPVLAAEPPKDVKKRRSFRQSRSHHTLKEEPVVPEPAQKALPSDPSAAREYAQARLKAHQSHRLPESVPPQRSEGPKPIRGRMSQPPAPKPSSERNRLIKKRLSAPLLGRRSKVQHDESPPVPNRQTFTGHNSPAPSSQYTSAVTASERSSQHSSQQADTRSNAHSDVRSTHTQGTSQPKQKLAVVSGMMTSQTKTISRRPSFRLRVFGHRPLMSSKSPSNQPSVASSNSKASTGTAPPVPVPISTVTTAHGSHQPSRTTPPPLTRADKSAMTIDSFVTAVPEQPQSPPPVRDGIPQRKPSLALSSHPPTPGNATIVRQPSQKEVVASSRAAPPKALVLEKSHKAPKYSLLPPPSPSQSWTNSVPHSSPPNVPTRSTKRPSNNQTSPPTASDIPLPPTPSHETQHNNGTPTPSLPQTSTVPTEPHSHSRPSRKSSSKPPPLSVSNQTSTNHNQHLSPPDLTSSYGGIDREGSDQGSIAISDSERSGRMNSMDTAMWKRMFANGASRSSSINNLKSPSLKSPGLHDDFEDEGLWFKGAEKDGVWLAGTTESN